MIATASPNPSMAQDKGDALGPAQVSQWAVTVGRNGDIADSFRGN